MSCLRASNQIIFQLYTSMHPISCCHSLYVEVNGIMIYVINVVNRIFLTNLVNRMVHMCMRNCIDVLSCRLYEYLNLKMHFMCTCFSRLGVSRISSKFMVIILNFLGFVSLPCRDLSLPSRRADFWSVLMPLRESAAFLSKYFLAIFRVAWQVVVGFYREMSLSKISC